MPRWPGEFGWGFFLRPSGIILLLVCGVAANRAAVWVAGRPTIAVGSAGAIPQVRAVSLDFGSVWESREFHWTLVLENTSDAVVRVVDIAGLCRCTRAERSELTIPPKGRGEVPLVIDLYQLRPTVAGRERMVSVAVTARVEVSGQPVEEYRWAASGRARRYLEADPLVLPLGEDLIAGQPGLRQVVRIRPTVGVGAVRLKRLPVGWSARLEFAPDEPSAYQLSLTPHQDSVGPWRETIELDALGSDGRLLATQPVVAEGTVIGPVELLPGVVDLGALPVGTEYRAEFSVVGTPGVEVQVEGIDPQGPSVCVSLTHACGHPRVSVNGPVAATGYGETTGTIRVKHGTTGSYSLPYRARWYGVANGTGS